jgi:glycine/D-amino acid oxidase-like deaminating enzyme
MTARLPLPPSLYADTAVPRRSPRRRFDVDKTVSVAIIGGGYTGLSTALASRGAGCRGPWCSRRRSRAGARPGNNGGHTNPGLKHDPDQIEADFGTDLGRRMIEFLVRHHQFYTTS